MILKHTLRVYQYEDLFSFKICFLDDRGFKYIRNFQRTKLSITRFHLGYSQFPDEACHKLLETREFKTRKELENYIVYRVVNFYGITSSSILGNRYKKAIAVLSKNYPELVL